MSLSGIALYCLRAGSFALLVCMAYGVVCLLRGKKPGIKCLLGLAYLAALIQITVLRSGVDWQKVSAGVRDIPQLIPFGTTVKLLGGSAWEFIYNVAGNLMWFVPLGMLLGRRGPLHSLLVGALVSAGIELSQYILMTGYTDVDDVILNAMGSLLGWSFYRTRLHWKKSRTC